MTAVTVKNNLKHRNVFTILVPLFQPFPKMTEDAKRDPNKTKRSRTDLVKNIVHSYLQKRNYASIGFQENSQIAQQVTYSLVESEISRPNSILYSCYNNDPVVIDHNFVKFLTWLRDLTKNKNVCHDIEYVIAPLFCHLYLDILKGGHSERAATFLKAHLPAIDRTKCDDFVKDLMNLFANDCDATCMIEQYRTNKYFLELSAQSLNLLKKFVIENCHVVFLHVFHTWFDLQQKEEKENEAEDEMGEAGAAPNGVCPDNKFQKMLNVIKELDNEQKQIFQVDVSNTKEVVNCALLDRSCRIIAFNQDSVVHLRPIHSFDSIIGVNAKEITFSEHSKRVYSISISANHTRLVTASEDSILCIYDLENMQLIKACSGHLGPIYCTVISSNSAYVASGSLDYTSRLWCTETGKTLRVFVGHTQAVTCIDFHPNSLYVATGSSDRNVRLWSVDNGSPLRLFHGCKGVVYGVAFSPKGDILATASDDKKVRTWDILSSKVNSEIKYKGDPITKLVWSKGGKQELCCASLDGILRVYSVDSSGENGDGKNQEPTTVLNINKKILALEYCFDTFGCITG